MRKLCLTISFMLAIVFVGWAVGGGGSGDFHKPKGTLSVNIVDAIDDIPVNDASITVYDSSNILVTRGLTVDGSFEYSMRPGKYIITVAAQDYLPVPPARQNAVPFAIIDGQTTDQNVALEKHPDAFTMGQISGYTLTPAPDSSAVPDVLVVAKDVPLTSYTPIRLYVRPFLNPFTDTYSLFNKRHTLRMFSLLGIVDTVRLVAGDRYDRTATSTLNVLLRFPATTSNRAYTVAV